jgi:voltage-gated potassium channel
MRLAPLLRALFSAEGLRYAALLTLLTALAGGAAFASVENIPVGDGVYWAVTTMTTVGYGDVKPSTPEGKVIAIAVMLVGIGFAALVIGAIAERFTNRHAHDEELTEKDLVKHVQEISARLQVLERVLLQRQSETSLPTEPRSRPGRSA